MGYREFRFKDMIAKPIFNAMLIDCDYHHNIQSLGKSTTVLDLPDLQDNPIKGQIIKIIRALKPR